MDDIEVRSPKRQRRSLSPDSSLYPTSTSIGTSIDSKPAPQTTLPDALSVPKNESSLQHTDATQPHVAGPPTNPESRPQFAAYAAPTEAHNTEVSASASLSKHSPSADRIEESGKVMADASPPSPQTKSQSHQRTDHDRQSVPDLTPPTQAMSNIGSAALICLKPYPISAPHTSQDLISLYNVNKIASSVARRDPLTGEKINKLRKSYEGKLKGLGLPGRNKATDRPRELLELLDLPDENWEDQMMLRARPLETALESSLMTKLEAALTFQPGQLPKAEHEHWKAILAIDDLKSAVTPNTAISYASSAAARTPLNIAPVRTSTSTLRETGDSRPPSPLSGSLSARPERANKKRRYDDASFDGYAEGFRDDDFGTNADDRRSSASRKRRRESPI